MTNNVKKSKNKVRILCEIKFSLKTNKKLIPTKMLWVEFLFLVHLNYVIYLNQDRSKAARMTIRLKNESII